ncbi:IS3 family transposase [Rhizobium bangladeshense]|uniref:IS3 family transposase n=1 Tax=Rhizobium bangladeshense TaxID=1138189 RepID=UPI001C903504|nr:IS3 family transposase [Rhizobium bangladeshense]MBY3617860.1 IS3 family transposase [Rhizobium bangladeshense]
MSKTTNKFSPEVRARAVRMVLDHEGEYSSRWAAVSSIAAKIGCTAQTLNEWVKKAEVDDGSRPGLPSEVAEKMKALERENRELRQANEILRKASAYFANGGTRPPIETMISFIDEHRSVFGVEPICKLLPIAPSTYYENVAKRLDVGRLSVRARCTVARLMRSMGLQGIIRGKPIRTTFPDKTAPSPLDRVNRQFKAPAPNRLWVSDFTYVATWQGFVYVAFVLDAFARRIVGWRVSRTAHAGFVLDALEQALHERRPVHGGLIHHSDRGAQYVSIKYSERLAEAGIEPSVGSVGDSYDNALAETINGLYKAELIHRRGPGRSFEAVEFATLEWVDWFNHRRLLEPIGNIPPAEAEEQYYAMLDEPAMAA